MNQELMETPPKAAGPALSNSPGKNYLYLWHILSIGIIRTKVDSAHKSFSGQIDSTRSPDEAILQSED